MPTDDFVTMTIPMRLSLRPALNVLNSMIMLCHWGSFPNREKEIALTDSEKQEIEIIFSGLYHGVVPQKPHRDFPSYLKYMASCRPEEIRDNILDFYHRKHNFTSGTMAGLTLEEVRAKVLASPEDFLDFLAGGFDPAHYDEEIERESFKLLNDPSVMRDRIATLLSSLWEKHFKERWENNREDLKDFIARNDISYLRNSTNREAISHVTGCELPSGKMDFFLKDNPPIEFVPCFDVENGCSKMYSGGVLHVFFDPLQFEKRRLNAQLNSIDELSRKLGAIADPNRLNILKYIMTSGEACSQDILKDMGFSQSAVSRHLKMLSDTGILTERRQMSAKYYRVNGEYLRNILSSVTGFLGI